jgi:hypothetical protein
MNNLIITTICLVILTGCAGYYSQFKQYPNQQEYSFDGEDRNFNLSQVPDDEDVGSQEIISFEQ